VDYADGEFAFERFKAGRSVVETESVR
jgi:hypothetical protein